MKDVVLAASLTTAVVCPLQCAALAWARDWVPLVAVLAFPIGASVGFLVWGRGWGR